MEKTDYLESLLSAKWEEKASQPFPEKASKDADKYFIFKNNKDTELGFAFFNQKQIARFRIFDIKTKEVSWFEIKMDSKINSVIEAIINNQNTIQQSEYFSLYFEISSKGEVAILAWEQYEDDYR